MAKSGTSSFILKIKLNTSEHDEHILNHRFWCAKQIYNVLIKQSIKQVKALRRDMMYRGLFDSYMKDRAAGIRNEYESRHVVSPQCSMEIWGKENMESINTIFKSRKKGR